MLDKRYREETKKKSLGEIDEDEKREEIKLAETREYDINEILSKAKENKQDDYEVERLKKLRNTQVDILNQLNIDALNKESNRVKAVSDDEKDELKTLIDTINLTEETNSVKENKKESEEMDPLDLLNDLKGSDDTKIEGVNDFTDEITKKIKEAEKEEKEELKEEVKEESEEKEEKKKEETKEITKTNKLDKSFYTNSTKFKTEDFEDFSDLKEELGATKIIIRILIVLIIIAFACGVVFLLNSILNWGLF